MLRANYSTHLHYYCAKAENFNAFLSKQLVSSFEAEEIVFEASRLQSLQVENCSDGMVPARSLPSFTPKVYDYCKPAIRKCTVSSSQFPKIPTTKGYYIRITVHFFPFTKVFYPPNWPKCTVIANQPSKSVQFHFPANFPNTYNKSVQFSKVPEVYDYYKCTIIRVLLVPLYSFFALTKVFYPQSVRLLQTSRPKVYNFVVHTIFQNTFNKSVQFSKIPEVYDYW